MNSFTDIEMNDFKLQQLLSFKVGDIGFYSNREA